MTVCNKCGGYIAIPYEPYSTSLPPCNCPKETFSQEIINQLKRIADYLEEMTKAHWAGPY